MSAHHDKSDNDVDTTPQEQDERFVIALRPTIALETRQWVEAMTRPLTEAVQWLVESINRTFSDMVNQLLDTVKPFADLTEYFRELEEEFRITQPEAVKILLINSIYL